VLEILKPRCVLHAVPATGLSNLRLKSLVGKRIALLSEKPESTHLLGVKKENLKAVSVFRIFEDPRQVTILVASSPPTNKVVWSSPVGFTSVNTDLAAVIKTQPQPFMTKVIRGATLTRAGR
jgi:hypothetical protein